MLMKRWDAVCDICDDCSGSFSPSFETREELLWEIRRMGWTVGKKKVVCFGCNATGQGEKRKKPEVRK